jgi:hypothetical protein
MGNRPRPAAVAWFRLRSRTTRTRAPNTGGATRACWGASPPPGSRLTVREQVAIRDDVTELRTA